MMIKKLGAPRAISVSLSTSLKSLTILSVRCVGHPDRGDFLLTGGLVAVGLKTLQKNSVFQILFFARVQKT